MTTPTEELRTAAEKLRALAAATAGSEQPWRYADGLPSNSVRTASGWEIAYGDEPANLRYIAGMHPRVGLALADWLRDSATLHLPVSECGYCAPGGNPLSLPCPALAVARAINGQEHSPA